MITQEEVELLQEAGYTIAEIDLQGGASVYVMCGWEYGYRNAEPEVHFVRMLGVDNVRSLSAYTAFAGQLKGRWMAYLWEQLVRSGTDPRELLLYEDVMEQLAYPDP